jgi:hypothetical protein
VSTRRAFQIQTLQNKDLRIEDGCTSFEHVDDWEGQLEVFLKNCGKKIGGPKNVAALAMLAMLLFDRAQAQ